MASRRSSRLQDPQNQKSSDKAENAPAQSEKCLTRKIPRGNTSDKIVGSSKGPKKNTANARVKVTSGKAEASNVQGRDKMLSLSLEILGMIADNITDLSNISALSRTCKRLFSLMTPRLYNRIAVAAMFHAHIAKLIRTLEPHLTIKQKKQLKKEGKYRGQKENYPTGLDEEKLPVCAGYVRQLIIGASNPGKMHKYIVERYYEEALKNMKNLEIVETMVLNRSICESIASLDGLKALSIRSYNSTPSDVAPLVHVKNLKHLHLQLDYQIHEIGQCVIRNSMSTLQSLDVITHSSNNDYFKDWAKNLKSSGHSITSTDDKGLDFPALRSVRLEGMMIDEEFIKEFSRIITLSKLRELTLVSLRDPKILLWPLLTHLITFYERSNTPLDLRTLSIDMQHSQYPCEHEKEKAQVAAKCAFIASFDTLTMLELPSYGQYSSAGGLGNPGLSETLLEAILKHQNLRILRISYIGKTSGLEIPYLGAKPIEDIIDGLPHLREFEFAPDESKMDGISQALCRGESLKSVTCFPHQSWHAYPRPDPLGMNILCSILSTFMSDAKVDAGGKQFVWEDHYKLTRLDLNHTKWDIASGFGKRQKGYGKAEKFQVYVGDNAREVWHQTIPHTQYVHVGYDPTFEWVTKVEKRIR